MPNHANVARFLEEAACNILDRALISWLLKNVRGEKTVYIQRSFAELDCDSRRVATLLRKRKVGRGTQILLMVLAQRIRSEDSSLESEAESDLAPIRGEELTAIRFTSRSTGPLKGVCYEHSMFEAQVRILKQQYRCEPSEMDLVIFPLFALFNPAFGKTTVVLEMNPSRLAKWNPSKSSAPSSSVKSRIVSDHS